MILKMPFQRRRHALSMLEVLMATGLSAIVLMPLAGLLRSSRVCVEQAVEPTLVAKHQSAGDWLRTTMKRATSVSVPQRDRLVMTVDGNSVVVRRAGLTLVASMPAGRMVLADEVRDVEFVESTGVVNGTTRTTGITMTTRGTEGNNGVGGLPVTITPMARPQS